MGIYWNLELSAVYVYFFLNIFMGRFNLVGLIREADMQKAVISSTTHLQSEGEGLLHTLMQVCGGVLMLTLFAQIRIFLGFTPVPITGQTLGVMLLGAYLSKEKAVLSVLAYLSLAALGCPVLANFDSGLAALTGVRAGYIIGFILQAYAIAWTLEKSGDRSSRGYLVTFLWTSIIPLFCGWAWLAHFIGVQKAFWLGVAPFVPGDLIKIALAAVVSRKYSHYSA